MPDRARAKLLLSLLAAVACGPPQAPGSSEGETGGPELGGEEIEGSNEGESSGSESGAEGDLLLPVLDMRPERCEPFQQNCLEGEKCVPRFSSSGFLEGHWCVPVLGEQSHGEPCILDGYEEGTDDCDATSACQLLDEVEGELHGICLAICLGSPDQPECPEQTVCHIFGDGDGIVCIPVCDPLSSDCYPGQGCYWTHGSFECIPSAGDTPVGEPCGYINDCAAGLTCVNGEAFPACDDSACCTSWCDLELDDGQCDGVLGTSCIPYFEEGNAPPDHEDVGVCAAP